jgi:hypothetical protein
MATDKSKYLFFRLNMACYFQKYGSKTVGGYDNMGGLLELMRNLVRGPWF